ncbi:hypothetical protein ACN47E_008424 [Coniothyrium glycines]
MQLTLLATALFASAASARVFYLYDEANFGGAWSKEDRPSDGACWNLNGKGDKTSSISADRQYECTTFYRERDCQGSQWKFTSNAATIPGFLNDHVWSYAAKC